MFLSAEYVRWLEKLPCNRHARRRQQKHGQWLDGWVPETAEREYAEPMAMQDNFIQRDAPDGLVAKLGKRLSTHVTS